MTVVPMLQLKRREEPPQEPPAPPADPHAYVDVPRAARDEFSAMSGAMNRLRVTLAGSFAMSGKLEAAVNELQDLAIAALDAAAAIAEAGR